LPELFKAIGELWGKVAALPGIEWVKVIHFCFILVKSSQLAASIGASRAGAVTLYRPSSRQITG
jgi:hypothetical protein